MAITMLQLFSYSVETITNVRLCKTAFKTIFFETKNILGSTNVSKARSTALNFPHNNVVIVIVSNCKYANTKATRTHFSRLCTARTLLYQGGICQGGSLSGRPLAPGQGHPTGRNMGPETETPRRNMGPEPETPQKEHGTRQPHRKLHHTAIPSVDRLTDMCKTLPCPKLCLRAVTTLQ